MAGGFYETQVLTATIAPSGSLSGQVNLGAWTLIAISMPATTWTTAALTFQASPDGGTTWQEATSSSGTGLSYTATQSAFILIDPSTLLGMNCIKVRSGTSGSPVTQSAGAVISLLVRGIA